MSNVPSNIAVHTCDTPQLLLEHPLKELRLPTILREYDKVARQCAVEQVDYVADHNRRFAHAATSAADFHRKRPSKA